MAENSGLDQFWRDCAAVLVMKGLLPGTGTVNGASHEFLARTAFALDQDGNAANGNAACLLNHALHDSAAVDDAFKYSILVRRPIASADRRSSERCSSCGNELGRNVERIFASSLLRGMTRSGVRGRWSWPEESRPKPSSVFRG